MMDFWDKISYMVQLLAACTVFLLPTHKRSYCAFRAVFGGALLITLAYVGNTFYREPESAIMPFTYWAFYIVISILFVWFIMEGTMLQATYCAICACGMQHIAFDGYMIYRILDGRSLVVSVWLYVVIYLLFYLFFARKLPEQGRFAATKSSLFPIVTIILLVWILSILENSSAVGFEAGIWHRVIYRWIDGLCCFYVLWVQINQKVKISLQRELDGINLIWQQQKKQYQMTRETIEGINRKCHDLKHQIRTLREIKDDREKEEFFNEIENDIMIYDTALQSGNKALDTVLMEKGLSCKNHGIQWSCMADGSKLEFMKPEDIYSIFGNVLDNAIEAVMKLDDPQKRIISVKIITQKELLMIQVQNYYSERLHFEDGLPVTTKKNKRDHGYGMKSIRYTAEKYNGAVTVRAENNIFMLQILLPVAV